MSQQIYIQISLAAALLSALIGLSVAVGWALDIPLLKSLRPEWVSMKVNTALALICSGLTLALYQNGNQKQAWKATATAAASIPLLIGTLTLIQYIFSLDLNIDQLFMHDDLGAPQTAAPGRPAPLTAICLSLVGASALLLNLKNDARLAQLLALPVLAISLFSLWAYSVNASSLYTIGPSSTAIALHTAFCLFLLSISIFFVEPGQGIIAIFTGSSATSHTLRQTIPPVIVCSTVCGVLCLLGERYKLLDERAALALMIASSTVIASAALLVISKRFQLVENALHNRKDQLRLQFEIAQMLADKSVAPMFAEKFIATIIKHFHWQGGIWWKVSSSENTLIAAAHQVDNEALTDLIRRGAWTLSLGECLPGQAWQRQEPSLVENAGQSLSFNRPNLCQRSAISSAFVLPVAAGSQTFGVFEFYFEPSRLPETEQIKLLWSIASQIGLFLSKLQLEEKWLHEEINRANERNFNQLCEAIPLLVWTCNSAGECDFINDKWCEYAGTTKAENLRYGWTSVVHPDDVANCVAAWEQSVKRKTPLEIEYRLRAKNGEYRWFLARALFVCEPGLSERWLGCSTDIEDQKQLANRLEALVQARTAEITRLNHDLLKSNKDLQSFAYVASHDLQEPLRAVTGYTRLLFEKFTDETDEKTRSYVAGAQDSAKRMQTLIEDLLVYAQVESSQKAPLPVRIEDLVQRCLRYMQETIEQTNSQIEITSELPIVLGDEKQLFQVFLNLISNAVKFAGNPRPRVRISASRADKDWLFKVEDNGIGLEMKHAERIFEMFQRLHTREEFPGTGIGLALCKRIVERHGGVISVDSTPGQGTTIAFTLAVRPEDQ